MKKFYLILIVLFLYNISWGQTTLISSSGDGGFETGTTFATNGWTVVNHATNTWQVGIAAISYAGTNGAYISNNSGTSWAYTTTSSQTSHFYRDVTIPSGETYISLSFQWKGKGELNFDRLLVYTAPTSVTPVAGTPASSSTTLTGATLVYTQANDAQATYTIANITLPSSLAGTAVRLIFTWQNDASAGNSPGVAIDNISLISQPPMTGTKTIKSSGGDYNSFTAAINAINTIGVGTGGVTFNVDAGFSSTELLPVITATGTPSNPIIFQKSGSGANPLITAGTGTGTTDGIVRIAGGDYITFDGIDVKENTSNITTTTQMEYGYYIYNASATDGAQNNTIKNCKITLNRTNTSSIGIYQNTSTTPTNQSTGNNNNNKYYNIIVENAYNGVYLKGNSSTYYDSGCEFGVLTGGNSVIGASSSNDIGNGSNAVYGIRASYQSGIKIYGTTIRNLNSTSTSNRISGIFLENSYGTSEVYNNDIGLISVSSTSSSTTNYLVSGMRIDVASGATANVYNNLIYGLSAGQTSSTSSSSSLVTQVAGIVMGITSGTSNLFYNNIRIEGSSYINSACIVSTGGTANTMKFKNNIFTNFTATQSGTPKHYCIMRQGSSGTISESNYNNYYISSSGNGYIGYYSADKALLADWKTALSKDVNSKNIDPNFTSSTNLHVFSTDLNAAGVTISTTNGDALNITTDYDGDTRASTPDIGADEFNIDCAGAVGGTASGSTSNCGAYTPAITASGYSLGNGSTYQWQSSTDNFVSIVSDISGQINPASLSVGSVTSSTYYRLKVTCNTGTATAYSNVVTITIKAVPTASAGSNTPVCTGNTLNLTGITDIGTSYNWSGPNGFTSTDINPIITNTTTANAGTYTFTTTYDGCNSVNATTNIVIGIMPSTVSISPNSQTIYAGQIENLVASGGNVDGGNGTIGTASSNSNSVTPYKISNKSTRTHIIYTAAELAAIGATANTPIYSISFTIPTNNTYSYTVNNFSISMKNTTTSKFSLATTEPFESGATQVFTPADVSIPLTTTSTYDVTHILTTPFYWDGTSNLLIETCLSNNTYGGTNASVRTPSILSNSMVHYISDNTDACAINSGGSINSFRPILKIAFQQPITKTWSPTTGLYTDAGATTAYTGNAINTVFAKPSVTTTYTAAATSNGCTSSNNSVITVTPTWLGVTNTDWSEASNWNYNIPTLSDNITIPSTASNQPHITTTNAVCNNLTINSGAALTIDADKALTVSGTLTNNAGNSGFVIKSGASLIHNTNNVAATMERDIAAANWSTTDEGWHVLSSPVSSQSISGGFTPIGAGNDYDFYAWDEASYTWLNQKVGANNITIFGAGFGYLVAYQQAGTKTFTGNLNNSNVNVTLNYANTTANKKGWNLLGNPYPCAMDWSNVAWDKTKIDGAKIWNSTTKNWVDLSLATTPNIIPANQGFIVKANAGGSFTIPAAARIHNGQSFYKSTSDMLILKAEKTGTTFNDVMGIDFNSSATLAFDTQKDAMEFETFGDAPSLYSVLSNGENLSINAVPAQLPASTVVNLNFKARTNGQYRINATMIPSIPACAILLLEDSKTNVTHNLKLNPIYNFTAATTDNINRFKLHFQTFTGIEETENSSTLVYAENDKVIIRSNSKIKSVEVYNEVGQQLSNYLVNGNNFNFSNKGKVQIIRIITENGIIVRKVINL